MCIAQDRLNKATPKKATLKLPVAKHELLVATSVGKLVHQPTTGMHRNTSNDTLTTVASQESHANSATVIACPSPTKEDTTDAALASDNNIVNNSIHQEDDFDFDFSFLQIPTGGIIDIPRCQDHEEYDWTKHFTSTSSFASEATIPTTHIRMRPKPLDLSSLGIVLKPKYHGIMKQRQLKEDEAKLPATAAAAVVPTIRPHCFAPPTKDFQGTVPFEDFVYETPKMQRIVGSMTTPPTTPRASGHAPFFVDYAKIPESLLMPMPF